MALPSEFAALEPYLDWDLATEPERYAKRLASTMPEMQAFYDVAFPKLNAVIDYVDKFPLDDLPEEPAGAMERLPPLVRRARAVEGRLQFLVRV